MGSDLEQKLFEQLSAFEKGSKETQTAANKKDEVQERTRQLQEPDPCHVAPHPYPTLVSQLKTLLAEYDSVLESQDQMRIDMHASQMTTLGSNLWHVGGLEMMRFTLYTYVPQPSHNLVGLAWDGVGAWRA